MADGDETSGDSYLVVTNLYRATLLPDLRLLSRRSRALSRRDKDVYQVKAT